MTVLVLGATSSIARETTRRLAEQGHDLVLAARDRKEAAAVAQDAEVRFGVNASVVVFDAEKSPHDNLVEQVLDQHGPLRGVVVCFGFLGDPKEAREDARTACRVVDVNLTGLVSVLTPLANHLADRDGDGFVVIVSSVAGDRGRPSNYVYGAAKAGVSAFASGLRARLHGDAVHVATVKPGFVDTRMTYGDPDTFLVASPGRVADAIMEAIEKRKNVTYVPWFWRPVLWALRAVPEPLFKRLDT